MLEVLFIESDNLRMEYILSKLETCDCNVLQYSAKISFDDLKAALQEKTYHFVFSIDYIVLAAQVCNESGTKYVSWVYEESTLFQDSGNIGLYYTNYVFIHDYQLYKELINEGYKTIYCLPLTEPDNVQAYEQYIRFMLTLLFKEGELGVFEAIKELEKARKENGSRCWIRMMNQCFRNLNRISESAAEEIYCLMAREKNPTFYLREQLVSYIDGLIAQKYINICSEIVTWYNRNLTCELRAHCWEFNYLLTFLNISLEEMRNSKEGDMPSILCYESMREMERTYLQTVFYLRRIEYDITQEDEREILNYIDQRGLSEIALEHIISEAQIFDKEKVRKGLRELKRKYEAE